MKKRKGFTLVELLVVIAILAILATASIVGYTAFTKNAKESNLKSELNQLRIVITGEDGLNGAFEITSENQIVLDADDENGDAYYWKNGSVYKTKNAYEALADQTGYTEVSTDADLWQAILANNEDLAPYKTGETKRLELFDSKKAVALADYDQHIVVVWVFGEDEIRVLDWAAYIAS